MKAALKLIMTGTGLLLIGLFIVIALLLTQFEGLLRDGLTYEAGRILQSEVRLESARFDWSERAFVFKGVTLFNPEGFTDRDLVRIESVTVKPDPLTLFSKTPSIAHISLGNPNIHLQFDSEQGTNLGVLTGHVQDWVSKQDSGHKSAWGRAVLLRELQVDAPTGSLEKLKPPVPTVPLVLSSRVISTPEDNATRTGAAVLQSVLQALVLVVSHSEGLDSAVKSSLAPPVVEGNDPLIVSGGCIPVDPLLLSDLLG